MHVNQTSLRLLVRFLKDEKRKLFFFRGTEEGSVIGLRCGRHEAHLRCREPGGATVHKKAALKTDSQEETARRSRIRGKEYCESK